MKVISSPVLEAIKKPESMIGASMCQWEVVISQAKVSNVLARLCYLLDQKGLLNQVPDRPRRHLLSANVLSSKQNKLVHWEVRCLRKAISKTGYPFILLKGSAYVLAKLPPHYGRIFTDVDILVPREGLAIVEKILMMHGWITNHHNAYDQKYYRKWMHELPPLEHVHRQSVLDVHHNILPTTARLHPDPKKLIHDARCIDGQDESFVFAPVDMVLHSATHLFHDGELENGLRDLLDLDALIRFFVEEEKDFWDALLMRSIELGLQRPLYYALRYSHALLETPVPDEVFQEADKGGANVIIAALMDALFMRALAPDHPTCDTVFTGVARWMLYVRSHYLRMPFYLLIPHLIRKALRRDVSDKEESH